MRLPKPLYSYLMICFLVISTVLAPYPLATVFANTADITALTTPIIYDKPLQQIGRIKVRIPGGAIKKDDVTVVKLPYALNGDQTISVINEDDPLPSGRQNYMFLPKANNGLQKGELAITALSPTEFKITALTDASFVNDLTFYIIIDNIDIHKGDEGLIFVQFDGPSDSGFPKEKIHVATIVNQGVVELTTEGTDASNTTFTFNLRLKEMLYQSLQSGDRSIHLKLPSGFVWREPVVGSETVIYGEKSTFSYTIYKNELSIHVENNPTTKASMWEMPLSFTIGDDNRVTIGDIYASVSGLTNTNVNNIKVGTYENYGASIIVAEDIPTIKSGKTEQKISTIKISEQVPKSIIAGRELSLTLPNGAKWVAADTDKDGIDLGLAKIESNGQALVYTISGSSPDEANLVLDQLKVAIRPDFTGSLHVTIAGAGIDPVQIGVANVVKPASITGISAPDVVIGKSEQTMADITIKESMKGALKRNGNIQIILPKGVQFEEKPNVIVTEGNLYLKQVSLQNPRILELQIDDESTKPSVIEISNANISIDRTVPEGAIEAIIKGSALIETTGQISLNGATYSLWKYNDMFEEVTIANVTTPAPGKSIVGQIQFKIGQKTYYVNTDKRTMDVAPFIEGSRTYLPIRYVAVALNVETDDILWDEKTRKVTIFKDNRVVQLTIGSKTMTLNGMAIPMDVPAKIKNERTYLPLRFVAEAFGADVDFHEPTRTVTIQ